MKSRVKVIQLKKTIVVFLLLYILNKNLLDWITGDIAKILYYFLIFYGALIGFFEVIKNKQLRPIGFIFSLYCLVIVSNGMLWVNRDQLVFGIKAYITYLFPLFAVFHYLQKQKEFRCYFDVIERWGAASSILAIYEYCFRKPILPGYGDSLYVLRMALLPIELLYLLDLRWC